MNSYHEYVKRIAKDLKEAERLPPGEAAFPEIAPEKDGAPVVLIFSPHPDDECITAGLPLRLLRETGCRVINVPVTFGSDPERRPGRRHELENACRYLGFGNAPLSPDGFDSITSEGRERENENWNFAVRCVTETLLRDRPRAVFLPHEKDGHETHIGTSLLVKDALKRMPFEFSCLTIETEYWHAMESPNLMVELDERTVGDIVTALSFHVEEVRRNPFHLSLPAWLIDNVRRGSEIVGSAGDTGKGYVFSVLYRVSRFEQGKQAPAFEGGRFISADESVGVLLEEI